ncbi:MAG TPA: AsmA family protein, partial [Bacteroidetes bacterium]|nr:AsmA family protein [Bacteroidota bacterium]
MPKKSHKKTRFVGRIVLIIIAIVIALLLILTGLFYFYKDDIGRKILLRVNNVQPGELAFDDIAFNPFAHLPNISIELNDVDYFEHKNEERGTDTLAIIKLEKLYIAFDVIDLLKGDVIVSQIFLKNGKANLITYNDSTFNLTNAFKFRQDTLLNNSDTTKKEQADFELDLKRIALSGIMISYNNMPNKTISSYSISSLETSLNIHNEIIKSDVDAYFKIIEINQSGGFLLNNKQVRIESSLSYDRNLNTIQIDPSKLLFDKANFTIDGNLDLNSTGFIDVSVTGDDKDFSVLNLFLSETGMNNIIGGNLFFTGLIKGQIFDEIPMIDFSFGIKDVEIQIPNTKEKISKLNLSGEFKSGERKDLSQASLKIMDLKAELPGGNLEGHFSIENFTKPIMDIEYKMMAEMDGFDKIFNINIIDSLTGKLEVNAKYTGTYDLTTKTTIEETESSVIGFKDLSFIIPDVNQVRNINGTIQLENDTTYFNDFKLEIGTSDFTINGLLTNLLSLIFNMDEKIEGNLKILSDTYDFPDFFKYDSLVATSFPYQIKDINLNVNVLTSTSNFTNFVVTPRIVFDIQSLEAEIKGFLPPVKINNGVFTLGLPFDSAQGDSSLNLDFSNFEIEIVGSKLLTDVVFNSPKVDPNWLTVDLIASDLNPQKAFVYWTSDSIPNYLDGKLDASMHLNLIFSQDSVVFDKLDLYAEQLAFANAKDTFDLRDLSLSAKDINYSTSDSSDFMKSLSFEIALKVKNANTNHFDTDNLDYEIEANNG